MLSIKYPLGEVYKSKDICTCACDFIRREISTALNIINIYKSKTLIVLPFFGKVSFPRKLGDKYNIKSLNSSFLIIENKRYKTILACISFNRKV